jgi:predicted nucleic acid-binding protein
VKVVDANVAVKWFVPESGEEQAQSLLLSQSMLVAPSIIRLEVLAAIVRCVRDQRSNAAEAQHRCNRWQEHLEDRSVVIIDDNELIAEAVKISLAIKHQLFDCLYLAACQRVDATLVTFDDELSKRAKRASIKCELLKEPKPH